MRCVYYIISAAIDNTILPAGLRHSRLTQSGTAGGPPANLARQRRCSCHLKPRMNPRAEVSCCAGAAMI